MKKITIKDIAQMANVSVATVSMVLNNKANISTDTRKKIKDLALLHNYVPNLAARGLVHSKTNTIGVLIADLGEPINAATIKSITKKMANTEYDIILYGASKSADWRTKLYHQINSEGRLDGVLHKAVDMTDADREIVSKLHLPIVIFENDLDWVDCVSIDNYHSTKIAMKYLIQKGHQKIGVVTCKMSQHIMDKRLQSIKDTLLEYGIELKDNHIYSVDNHSPYDGLKAADYYHCLNNKPTALFVISGDYVATGLLSRLKMLGYCIPDDFAIIGYDDLWFSSFIEPQLTTIRQPMDEMVSAAIDLLIARINDKNKPPESRKFNLEFIIRQSA